MRSEPGYAIVLTMKASPTAVFPHRGLAPHQFTRMSGAHKITGANAGGSHLLHRMAQAQEPRRLTKQG
jgi:hypothetical protein